MKKLFLFLIPFLFLGAVACFAMEWYATDSVVIQWDPVTMLENEFTVPETDTISYNVYVTLETDIDKTNPVFKGNTAETTHTVTFGAADLEGRYFVGLQTVRTIGGFEASKSRIGWSDEPEIVSEGKVFGLSYFSAPVVPTGMRRN